MPTSPDNDLANPLPGHRSADSRFSPDEQPLRVAARWEVTANVSTKDPGPVNPTLTSDEPDNL